MKIAIDARITYNSDALLRRFTIAFWEDVAISQAGQEFIIIGRWKKTSGMPANVEIHLLKKGVFKWLEQQKLNRLLDSWKADRLVTLQETGFSVQRLRQGAIQTSPAVENKQVLFTGSLQNKAADAGKSIIALQPALPEIMTDPSWAETESIKTQYTGGRSFFLFTGNIEAQQHLVELLKAFSVFKKWQQSNMQLVIAGSSNKWTEILEEKLLTYKYKADVVLVKNPVDKETARLVAASYALLYPAAGNVFPLAMLWAVQGHKAVIATSSPQNRQITGAAVWVEPADTTDGFAKAMIQLYKDENQLQLLVQQTKEQSKQFNRQQMIADAWQCIEQ